MKTYPGWLKLFLVFTVCFLLTGNLAGGIFMTEADGSKTYIANGKLKEISADDGMIMDSKSGNFIYFSPAKKIYTRGKITDFCQAMKEMVDQMLASMPADYKEMIGVGKQQEPPKVEIITEGEGGKIAGYVTEKYKVLANGVPYETIWLATDASLIKEFKSLVEMLSEFQKCVKIMDFGAPPVEFSAEYVKLMKKGLTLKSIHHEDGMEKTTVNTVRIEVKDIPDSEFTVPAGYEEMSFSEYFDVQMSGDEGDF